MNKLENILNYIKESNYGKYKPELVEPNENLLFVLINEIGKKYEPNFEIKTEFDKQLYQNLIYYFSDDSRCEWDLSKGLFFHGKKGTGKSLSIKIMWQIYFHRNLHNQLQLKKSFKCFAIEGLSRNVDLFKDLCEKNLFCDEVMRETKDDSKVIVNFGTREQPFSDGVHSMYRNFCNKGNLYHFTSNYWNVEGASNGELISKVYGGEIHDRLIEMCNFVEFKGCSKRK